MKNIKLLFLLFSVGIVTWACSEDEFADVNPPRADFNITPELPVEGVEVLLYADPSSESGQIVSWHWEFNDGTGATATKRNPYYTFPAAGEFEVALTVTNAAGEIHTVTKTVTVAAPPKEFIGELVWSITNGTTVSNINEGSNAPAIGDDGTIYYIEGNAAAQSTMVAVTDNGDNASVKWATVLGNQVSNAPSIGHDGNLYINTWAANRTIAKIEASSGDILWSGSVGTGVSNNTPAVDDNGNVYHGSRQQGANGGAYSWTPDGEKRWEITGVGAFYAAPVINKDGTTAYFLNTSEGRIWAVNTEDGSQKWESPVGPGSGTHGSSLSMDADGTVYYTTNAHIVAIEDNGSTGAIKWAAEVTGAAQSGVVVGENGDLYSGSSGGLVSLNPDNGEVNWTYNLQTIESVPAVDTDGNVYIGTADGKLAVITAQGLLAREFQLGTGAVNSPVITEDGTVYVEGRDESHIKLHKIAVEESGPANSYWPMKGKNLKNTAKAD
ncbi:outer membrane protein assembly factor BamB family protein [Lunatibacter salilacus]|uniref:outer membrane protein assembly factor BamB family protein n=1 Tax=Lunatibacter salilacus TaxID=2483804 RepID=UPI00131EB069|nr:PQQ-binding-like beta-propeller repeat protein [Lunatibacter salilacus]